MQSEKCGLKIDCTVGTPKVEQQYNKNHVFRPTQWEEGVCVSPCVEYAALNPAIFIYPESPSLALPDDIRTQKQLVLQVRVRPSLAFRKHCLSSRRFDGDTSPSIARSSGSTTSHINIAAIGACTYARAACDGQRGESEERHTPVWVMCTSSGKRLTAMEGIVAYGLMIRISE